MIDKSELLRVPTFADLPDEQLEWFLSQCQEQLLNPGDTYIRQGDAAENMFVMLEGEFQARGEINGETFAFPVKAGEMTGVLPFCRNKSHPVTEVAISYSSAVDCSTLRTPPLRQ